MAGGVARMSRPSASSLRLRDVRIYSEKHGDGFVVTGGAHALAAKRAERHQAPMMVELRVNDMTVDGGALTSSEGAKQHAAASAAGATAHRHADAANLTKAGGHVSAESQLGGVGSASRAPAAGEGMGVGEVAFR